MTRHASSWISYVLALSFLKNLNLCVGLLVPKEYRPAVPPSLFYQEDPEMSSEYVTTPSSYDLDIENEHDAFISTENDDVEYENYPSYHTLDPTFELLVDWTLDYADAVDLAGGMTRVSVGVESMIADDYVFTSPEIGPISKNDFISLMNYYQHNGLDLGSAIPDLTVAYEVSVTYCPTKEIWFRTI